MLLNIFINTDQKHSGLSESVCPNVSRKITNYRLYKQADIPYFYCGPQKERKKKWKTIAKVLKTVLTVITKMIIVISIIL